MNKYSVCVRSVEEAWIDVEAENEQEAYEKAGIILEEDLGSVHWQPTDEPYTYYDAVLQKLALTPDEERLEAMIQIFRQHDYMVSDLYDGRNERIGIVVSHLIGVDEYDIEESHAINCNAIRFAEGFTAENLVYAWSEITNNFDPEMNAWGVLTEWSSDEDAGRNMRHMLELYDAYALEMRMIRTELRKELADLNTKKEGIK